MDFVASFLNLGAWASDPGAHAVVLEWAPGDARPLASLESVTRGSRAKLRVTGRRPRLRNITGLFLLSGRVCLVCFFGLLHSIILYYVKYSL